MSKYFQATQRGATTVVRPNISTEVLPPLEDANQPPRPVAAMPVALVERGDLIVDLARDPSLCRLSEQLAALGTIENPIRLLVSGCRSGDGASTIAAALALDL